MIPAHDRRGKKSLHLILGLSGLSTPPPLPRRGGTARCGAAVGEGRTARPAPLRGDDADFRETGWRRLIGACRAGFVRCGWVIGGMLGARKFAARDDRC